MRAPALTLEDITPWWPHPQAKPKFGKLRDGRLRIAANGTRACSGAWRVSYSGAAPGSWYEISAEVSYADVPCPRDALGAIVRWSGTGCRAAIDQLIPQPTGPRQMRLGRILQVPPESASLTVECFFRWSQTGRSIWSLPIVRPAAAPVLRPARVCIVTGSLPRVHARAHDSIADNIGFYRDLCEAACAAVSPDLVALPEVAPQWEVPGSPFDTALPVPSKETDVFAAIARRHQTYLALGVLERDGDAVFNSAVLFDRRGALVGRYHKVHLASGSEWSSGILPGDSFPVFDTDIGRIGFNICMDSSAAESSRAVGLNGGDFLVLPIMGDHRADRFSPGPPIFSDDRWRAIMRVRALDNQLTMVVARNEGQGSCIVNRRGDFLAFNEGDEDFIWADVPPREPYRELDGYCFRDVNWVQRRPRVYGLFVDEACWGNMRPVQTTGDWPQEGENHEGR